MFNALLDGQDAPPIDDSTAWEDLPIISLQDLRKVLIPRPQNLEPEEMALPSGGINASIDDLLNGRIDNEKTIASIMDDEENLRAVSLTSATRHTTPRFHKWLDRQCDSHV